MNENLVEDWILLKEEIKQANIDRWKGDLNEVNKLFSEGNLNQSGWTRIYEVLQSEKRQKLWIPDNNLPNIYATSRHISNTRNSKIWE